MKKTKRRALYVFAALLATLFVASCLVGFAACGGSDESDCDTNGHTVTTWTWVDGKEADCGNDGTRSGVCDVCGETVTETVKASGNHTSDGGKVTKEADCGNAGETTFTCTVCGQVLNTEVIAATDAHVVAENGWTTTTEADCTNDGVKTGTCTVCEQTVTEVIPATGHDYQLDTNDSDYKEATCGAEGTNVYVCSKCQDSYTETSKATGDHSYDWTSGTATASTADSDGYVTYTCSVCQNEVTTPYYNENGEFLAEAEDGLLYPDPSTSTLSFGVEEHHSGTSGSPASGGRNIKDFEDGSFVAFRINASEAVTGATLSVIGASNNNVLGASELDMSNAKVTLNNVAVALSGTYPTAGGVFSFNYTAWGIITVKIDLQKGDNILVFYGMEKTYQYNFDCIMIGLPTGSESVTLTDTTMGVEETTQGANDGQDPLTVCEAVGHELVGTYASSAWTYTCSVCSETITLSTTTDVIASLTLTATDEDSFEAAGLWGEVSIKGVTPVIDVATTTENNGTVYISSSNNHIGGGVNPANKDVVLNADIEMGTDKVLIVRCACTLDLNGHSISLGTSNTSDYGVIQVGATNVYGDLTVKDSVGGGKISGTNGVTVRGDANSNGDVSTFTLVSGTIEGSNIAVSTNGSSEWGSEVVNIQGGTVSGTADTGMGIYMPNGTLKVTGGTISGTTGIEIKSGTASVSGAAISTTVTEGASVTTKSNGPDSYGYAIAIISTNTSYHDLKSVEIGSGCTLTGDIYSDALDVTDEVTELVSNIVTMDDSLNLTRFAYTAEGNVATGSDNVAYYIFTVVEAGEDA